jgi:hypothetical protein
MESIPFDIASLLLSDLPCAIMIVSSGIRHKEIKNCDMQATIIFRR